MTEELLPSCTTSVPKEMFEDVEEGRHVLVGGQTAEEESFHITSSKNGDADDHEPSPTTSTSTSTRTRTTAEHKHQHQHQQSRLRRRENEVQMDEFKALVQKEIKAVSFVRALVLILIAVSCAATATSTYLISEKAQSDVFVREYNALASATTERFLAAVTFTLSTAYTQSISMSVESRRNGGGTHFYQENFDDNVRVQRVYSTFDAIAWSPILHTEDDRLAFEEYAATKETEQVRRKPDCSACGKGMEVGNPTAEVSIPGAGTFECVIVERFLTTTAIPSTTCASIAQFTRAVCGCIPREEDVDLTVDSNAAIDIDRRVQDGIFRLEQGKAVDDPGPGPYSPIWQISPPTTQLFNLYSTDSSRNAIDSMLESGLPVASEWFVDEGPTFWNSLYDANPTISPIHAIVLTPVFDGIDINRIIGSIAILFNLEFLLASKYQINSEDMLLVYENSCGQVYTYVIESKTSVRFLGEGDQHDPKYDSMVRQTEYGDFHDLMDIAASSLPGAKSRNATTSDRESRCAYRLRLYPSKEFESRYDTKYPLISTMLVVLAFVWTTCLFFVYDFYVAKLQRKLVENAARTSRIVSNLFPAGVLDRLLGSDDDYGKGRQEPAQLQLKSFLTAANISSRAIDTPVLHSDTEPIAELFSSTTVMFADIEGFTAWASEREPAQVFQLLEAVYQAFDDIAYRLGIFKVETIGDCYVAVSGLPEPTEDHAVIMTQFAFACMLEMQALTKTLEASLGPGTSSLAMRFGLHSGPVLAGVLRGEKARFQLFGDTMNTARRIESSGKTSRIHVSKSTATLLEKAGKVHWITKREEHISLKGKGRMETFWVEPVGRRDSNTSIHSYLLICSPVVPLSTKPEISKALHPVSVKYDQLIEWNTDLLLLYLQKVVGRRNINNRRQLKRMVLNNRKVTKGLSQHGEKLFEEKVSIMDEVTEIMEIPEFNEKATYGSVPDLGDEVRSQLRSFVSRIVALYRDVPFHNFEHASHVSLSASKLLKRINSPEGLNYQNDSKTRKGAKQAAQDLEKAIHDSTFGISSDPLIQLSIIFATLIHDVNHTGVANKQHVRLGTEIAVLYGGKCVAEQHSVILAWKILMEDDFGALRACIYDSTEEGCRFRQLVVNAVIATDIADKELQTLRKTRWGKAFQEAPSDTGSTTTLSTHDDTNRKATIVFEHIIQASDVAHTMQHWKVYQRWNEHLFEEMYFAYTTGHSDEDPVPGWYKGELGFFDFYIIPLAQKLEKCGIFGVSSDEYLNYALENRSEWEMKGKAIVKRMIAKYEQKYTEDAIKSAMASKVWDCDLDVDVTL